MIKRIFYLVLILWGISSSVFAVAPKGTVPEIEVIQIVNKPKIDGVLDDEAWVEVARSFTGILTGWKNLHGTSIIENQRIVLMGYDETALYIGMICYVDDITRLRFGNDVFRDDTLEIHLENTQGEYFHAGISCSGQRSLSTASKLFLFESATKIGDNHWSLEVAIPWESIRIKPEVGTEIGFNFAGNDYKDRWITWGPSYGAFQRPETFSYLRLK